MDVVAGDADVVGRGAPAEADLAEPPVAVSVPGALGAVVSGALIERVHVGLDLGGGEGAVVDADFVDLALEPLAPDRVAADLQRAGGGRDRAG